MPALDLYYLRIHTGTDFLSIPAMTWAIAQSFPRHSPAWEAAMDAFETEQQKRLAS